MCIRKTMRYAYTPHLDLYSCVQNVTLSLRVLPAISCILWLTELERGVQCALASSGFQWGLTWPRYAAHFWCVHRRNTRKSWTCALPQRERQDGGKAESCPALAASEMLDDPVPQWERKAMVSSARFHTSGCSAEASRVSNSNWNLLNQRRKE